jgi:biopolymer transport protein ExbD
MAKKKKKRRTTDEASFEMANMTPMIDCVFQLLIFFMLSMHFKEVEGKLLSQLPKDKGLAPSHVLQPELQEVRIVLCAGGDTRMHLHDKGRHEKEDKLNDMCKIMVEKVEIGEVYKTEKFPDKIAHNKGIYKSLGVKTAEIYQVTPSARRGIPDPTKRPPVILDADSETPYEHVIGAMNACKENGIDNVEFVGNPRLEKYYGSFQKGQFERNRKK